MSEITFEEYKHLVEEQGRALLDVIQAVALGNLDVEIEVPEGIEILSDLGVGLEIMVDDLRTRMAQRFRADLVEEQSRALLDVVQSVAIGDMDAKVPDLEGIDVLSDLAIGLEMMVDDLREMLSEQEKNRIEVERGRQQLESALEEVLAVQRRYLRQEWEEYAGTPGTSQGYLWEGETDAPSDDAWLPSMTSAVERAVTVIGGDNGQATLSVPIQLYNEVIGVLGFGSEQAEPWSPEDVEAVEAVAEQIAWALENQRLFDDEQRSRQLLGQRVGELDCLNDIGRQMDETPPIAELLEWVAQRIPSAMQYPGLCRVAIEFEGEMYGAPEAIQLPCQIVQILRTGRQRMGQITIAYTKDRDFLDEESALMGDIGRRVSGYIESQRLLAETTVRAERLAVVNRISSTVGATFSLDELMESVYGEIAGSFLTDAVFVTLYHEETNELEFILTVEDGVQFTPERHPLSGFSSIVVGEKKVLRINDVEKEREHLPAPVMVGDTTKLYASWLGVPMLLGDRVLGLVAVMVDRAHAYGEEEELLLTTIADQVAVALERARLLEDTRTRAEELAVLNEMSRDMAAMLDVFAIVENLHAYSSRLMDLTSFYVALYNEQENEVSFPLFVEHGERVELASRRGGKGLTEYIIRSGRPLLIEENVGERLQELGLDSIGEEALSWLGVPMAIGERILGVIAVQSYVTPGLYDEHHRDLLVAIASQAAIAIENARLLEQTRARAERERMVRTITDRVRRGGDAEAIMRVGLEGLSQLLGAPDLVMRLGTRDTLRAANAGVSRKVDDLETVDRQ